MTESTKPTPINPLAEVVEEVATTASLTPEAVSRRKLLNSALIVMGATLASRLLGVLRESVLAYQFGTSADIGAYRAAFRIPDTLYLLFIGGALGSSLIPVFSSFLGQKESAKAWRLANAVVNYAMVALVIFSGLAWLLAPVLVGQVLAPGFVDDPATFQKTVDLSRLLILQPFFLGLGGIALALLNGSEKFFWPAIAPLIYNFSIILGVLFLADPLGIFGVAWGVLIGAVFYFLIQFPALKRAGFYWRPGLPRNVPGARQVMGALGPRLLGQAAFQLNFFVITNLASRLSDGPGKVAALENAYQLFMLPHGIFAISLATVAFPAMSRLVGAGNLSGMVATLGSSLRQVLFLTLPASVGLALLAEPIVKTILASGQFNQRSVELVSFALVCFSFGLVGYGVVEILTRAFYAMQDTITPVAITILTVALNTGLSILLLRPLEHGGLALALALSTTLEMGLLALLLHRKIHTFMVASARAALLSMSRIILAAALMGAVLLVLRFLFATPLDNANVQSQIGAKLFVVFLTGIMIILGGAVYGITAYLLRVEELQTVVRRFIRRR